MPAHVQTDKELLATFLVVNAMFQSMSNIRSFPQVWPNTSVDRVHEIVVLVTKSPNVEAISSRRVMMNLRHDDFLDIRVLDTGLATVLTQRGLLAGEGHSSATDRASYDNQVEAPLSGRREED